ncbi:MAG: dipeptide/oligopeptide/nickel ABC transporter permease/ATP-binding protein [Ilumatobacter sp.]|uniref:dipeptide/oligopeptide/nickel ABC transporter permease/ATP-binding protein n=1 Tax=Ilumatobacter sp. TaxID=1967498 RepID=UPI003C70E62B
MALVEPGPTGVKTAAEASASVEHPAADLAERKLGFVFWMAVAWILLLVFLAVFRDLLPLRDPEALGIRTREVRKYEDPSWNAWFGADSQGRDQLARVVQGTRPALIIGVTVTVIAGFLGTAIGVTSGYLRGRVDAFTTVVIDIFLAFPGLVLLIAVRASFGNSMSVFIVLFSITSIPAYARIVRGASFALSEREFVDAAAAMGATKRRVLWKELAPNVAIPALSFAFIGFALVIVGEGALAFIGLSLDEVTWGKLIAEGTGDIRDHAHISLIPATVMFLTILAFNLAGDGVRRLYSPREVATQRRLRVEGIPAENHDGSVLHISDLYTTLHTPTGDVHAVDGVSMSVRAGQALGIVGESGSGKTMILRSIVGAFALSDVTRSGTVEVAGVDMLRAERSDVMRTLGTEIGMISQNPLTALNPVRRIETQIIEPMTVHRGMSKAQARERALDLLRLVGIPAPERRLREYPHQLSGGMRQRVTIAIALANEPKLLLADEPTTALDVTVQDQILRLLSDLQQQREMAMVLVTHDLAVVKGFTDSVAIVYGGQVVEFGPTAEIFANPRHRYTVALMQSMPDLDLPSHSELTTIEGTPPSLLQPPPGCRFTARCPAAQEVCESLTPSAVESDDHWFRCHFPADPVPVSVGTQKTSEHS